MDKIDLRSLTLPKLEAELANMGEKSFRAKQIFSWLHQKQVTSFDEMTNLSKALREKLKENYIIKNIKIVEKLVSKEDNTNKYLFDIGDDIVIESVLMRYSYGNAVCISSQAGCRMGCTFCASTVDGLERNLLAGEMAAQIYEIQRDIGERVSNVVIMGSGEPLDNYDNVMDFLEIIHSKEGNNLSHRHITLSTCGLVDKIYDLAKENLQITLAISLHAPNNEIRQNTMPVAKRYDIDSLIKAAKDYADTTKRRVTFEYALIKGVNDSKDCARELASRLKGIMCHINLIPVNDVKENNYIRSTEENINSFASLLRELGIETTVRRKLGSDINAACGQLRKSYKNRGKVE
ncbi:MAG: 23S rRNA (adenine(2503)-C(2))-methyltransferase RlmN [Lachnospirales bacterium]